MYMDFQDSIYQRIDTLFKNFLYGLSDKFNIDYNELCQFAETIDLGGGVVNKTGTCMHKMISGKNKGKFCVRKALDNGYCSTHQKSALVTVENLLNKQKPKKGMTKTQIEIIEWLNTAVPQEETVLKKCSKGFHHEETDIIFNDTYCAIGRRDEDKIVKLTHFEVELCEKYGWHYDQEAVEEED